MSIENNSIYGNESLPSSSIEECTKTITEEGKKEEKILGLDTNLILIIFAILGIILFLGWSDG